MQRRAKGLIGSAAEGNSASFPVIVSWKDQSLQSCDIHESSQCFRDVTLYPGWVRVVVCLSDVTEFSCRVVFVSVAVAIFPMMT